MQGRSPGAPGGAASRAPSWGLPAASPGQADAPGAKQLRTLAPVSAFGPRWGLGPVMPCACGPRRRRGGPSRVPLQCEEGGCGRRWRQGQRRWSPGQSALGPHHSRCCGHGLPPCTEATREARPLVQELRDRGRAPAGRPPRPHSHVHHGRRAAKGLAGTWTQGTWAGSGSSVCKSVSASHSSPGLLLGWAARPQRRPERDRGEGPSARGLTVGDTVRCLVNVPAPFTHAPMTSLGAARRPGTLGQARASEPC